MDTLLSAAGACSAAAGDTPTHRAIATAAANPNSRIFVALMDLPLSKRALSRRSRHLTNPLAPPTRNHPCNPIPHLGGCTSTLGVDLDATPRSGAGGKGGAWRAGADARRPVDLVPQMVHGDLPGTVGRTTNPRVRG
ncbi:hypothetical protein Acsp05_58090 [Actinokineospora sp. NBRC 105648]|nr:hypothetical protein Acsp05_58090 [Actinokineospora sp. NBRC 105648]